MKNEMKAMIFTDKTRWQHFWVGIALSLTLTILCTLGAMTTAEYKDKAHGGLWDWYDWTAGMIGGIIGQAIQIVIIYFLIKN